MDGCIPVHQWSFRGEYDYDRKVRKDNVNDSTNKGRFVGNYEYRFWSPWALRLEEELSFNVPQGLRIRSDAFVSLGYYAIETCDITLELLAGFGHEDSYFSGNSSKIDEHDFELDLGWELKWTFVNGWKLWQEFEYAPAVDHFNDYRVYMDNELTIPVYKCWGIGLEYEFTYLSQVPPGKKNLDSTISVKLTYDF